MSEQTPLYWERYDLLNGYNNRTGTNKSYPFRIIEESLYNNAMDLCLNSDVFFYTDYKVEAKRIHPVSHKPGPTPVVFRVFNYRLASYTDFLKPLAMEMRGMTFIIEDEDGVLGQPILASRPFIKFFNLNENPLTTDLDMSEAEFYETKEDGSLIMTARVEGCNFILKSKQAFYSKQAIMATEIMNLPENIGLKDEIQKLVDRQYTVLMELCSPANRIVLPYERTELRIHGLRNNVTGLLLHPHNYLNTKLFREVCARWVRHTHIPAGTDFNAFLELVKNMTGVEGYVVTGSWGKFKIKTEWYKNLHHLKDSVSTIKKLIEAILYERIDDVKTMFDTDEITLNRITKMEEIIIPRYNEIVKKVEAFHRENKELDRKSYAIKGQRELGTLFSLAMNLYIGREVDYRGYCMKYLNEVFNLTNVEGEKEDDNTDN